MACEIRGIPIFVEGVLSPEEADVIAGALRVFPDPFLRQFVLGRNFVVLPREDFERVAAGPAAARTGGMGIAVQGPEWFIRDDLLVRGREGSFTQRLWYAVAGRMADELEGEEGFDRRRFQAAFNRYMNRRLGNPLVLPWLPVEFSLPGVDPLYQLYFDRLAESERFDPETLREVFQEARREASRPREPVRLRLLVGQEQPWRVRRLYEQFVERGFTWKVGGDDTVSLGLQSAASRDRPESGHRLNLHYTNAWINDRLAGALWRLFPGLSPTALWAPGIVGSYEARTAGGGKGAVVLAGSLLDVGAKLLSGGEFALHSYVGVPLLPQTGDADAPSNGGPSPVDPEWEVGLTYRGLDGALFFGTMLSVSFADSARKYYGLVLRFEE